MDKIFKELSPLNSVLKLPDVQMGIHFDDLMNDMDIEKSLYCNENGMDNMAHLTSIHDPPIPSNVHLNTKDCTMINDA